MTREHESTEQSLARQGVVEAVGTPTLFERVLKTRLTVPRRHQRDRGFFKELRRAAADPRFRETVQQFRDRVIRSSLNRPEQESGMVIALSGVRGGEGTSFLAFLLTLVLGSSRHYKVAFLDGRFSRQRFSALSQVLSLSRNACTIHKGATLLEGNYNEAYPNVYFLNNPGREEGLEFFSDRELQSCFAELRRSFDFTVIDMPPLLTDSSNTYVAPLVDSLYVVVSAGRTRLADLTKCTEVTGEGKEKEKGITGVVVNHQKIPLWARLFWREYFF